MTTKLPPIIYKYSAHGLAILENLELKVTPPNEFNDPFEFTPRMIWSNPRARAVSILRNKDHIKTLYQRLKDDQQFAGTLDEFQTHIKNHEPEIALDLARYIPIGAAEVRKELLDKVSGIHGVLCLSKRCDSILMWGHYCDSHQGLVVGFDPFNAAFHDLRPVKYVFNRVVFDATWIESDPKIQTFNDEIIFSKNQDWVYEAEFRQLFRLSDLNKKPLENGPQGYFLQLPASAIVSVLLGARCSSELTKKTEAILSQSHFSHVTLNRAALHESEYSLTFN